MSTFDEYGSSYRAEVERAIAFAGQEHSFFIEEKIRVLLEIAARRLGDLSRVRGLDVGCGQGDGHAELVRRLASLDGVDVSLPMLEAAASGNDAVEYHHYGGDTLPFADGSFDLAFAFCVFHHVAPDSWMQLATEMSRVVRSGGLVAIAEHNPFNPLTRLVVARCAFDDGTVLLQRKRVTELLSKAGVNVTDAPYIVFLPWRVPVFARLAARLCRLPLGAQYVVAGTRP